MKATLRPRPIFADNKQVDVELVLNLLSLNRPSILMTGQEWSLANTLYMWT